MTYKDQFVAEVKVNGKILRVKDESVYLPFGSEYSILLKNLNSRRASITISIDSEDVLDGQSLILEANSSTEVEGFLRGNVAKNRFKFIHKTEKIQEHRGDKADDGMIRIEFAYEKVIPKPEIRKVIEEVHHNHYYHNSVKFDYYCPNTDWTVQHFSTLYNGGPRDISSDETMCGSTVTMDSLGVQLYSAPLDEEGITVKGSEITQQYQYSSIGELEQSEVIVIRLKGISPQTQTRVHHAVTVKTKLECSSCGTKSKSLFKFCPECGTYLE